MLKIFALLSTKIPAAFLHTTHMQLFADDKEILKHVPEQ